MRGNLKVLIGVMALSGLGGCDPSKEELDKTKAQLQTVTSERDGLKTQLAAAQGQATAAQQQLSAAQQAAADATTKHNEHMKEHAAAGGAPATAPGHAMKPAEQIKEIKATAEKKVTKGGSSADQ